MHLATISSVVVVLICFMPFSLDAKTTIKTNSVSNKNMYVGTSSRSTGDSTLADADFIRQTFKPNRSKTESEASSNTSTSETPVLQAPLKSIDKKTDTVADSEPKKEATEAKAIKLVGSFLKALTGSGKNKTNGTPKNIGEKNGTKSDPKQEEKPNSLKPILKDNLLQAIKKVTTNAASNATVLQPLPPVAGNPDKGSGNADKNDVPPVVLPESKNDTLKNAQSPIVVSNPLPVGDSNGVPSTAPAVGPHEIKNSNSKDESKAPAPIEVPTPPPAVELPITQTPPPPSAVDSPSILNQAGSSDSNRAPAPVQADTKPVTSQPDIGFSPSVIAQEQNQESVGLKPEESAAFFNTELRNLIAILNQDPPAAPPLAPASDAPAAPPPITPPALSSNPAPAAETEQDTLKNDIDNFQAANDQETAVLNAGLTYDALVQNSVKAICDDLQVSSSDTIDYAKCSETVSSIYENQCYNNPEVKCILLLRRQCDRQCIKDRTKSAILA